VIFDGLLDISRWKNLFTDRLLFRECCSRCRFQPYDCVIIRFVE